MIEFYVPAASTYAADIDSLFELMFWMVGFWFVLCEAVFFWLILRFRKRALDDRIGRAVRSIGIDDRRNLAVRIDGDIARGELVVLTDIDRMNVVLQAAFLKHDGGSLNRARPITVSGASNINLSRI